MAEKQEKSKVEKETSSNKSTQVAVIETGSKQYIIKDGDILDIEKIDGDISNEITFDKVLLLSDENGTQIGTPYVEGAEIKGTILNQHKDKKKIVFKFKRKTGYKRFKGHRQNLTTIKFS